MRKLHFVILFLSIAILNTKAQEIKVSKEHPQYWEYNGEPVLLLGGSVEDNLFQIPNLEEHLDLLKSVGGNYVRNTMSGRDEGNVWPFEKGANGIYDLNKLNPEYWNRFENFLEQTSKRDIIVQIEVWATFDFYRDIWEVNPYNPKNNKNYGVRQSKLDTIVSTHPTFTENNFFRSVPSQMSLSRVLWYQQVFVDKLLSYSLKYGNVLYCMDNETSVTSDWGKFWATYIQKKAKEQGKSVYCTEMWDPWDLSHAFHSETFDNPDIFGFVDISQNNHQTGQAHWDNGLKQIERLKKVNALRPVTNIKIYGNDGGRHKTTRNAIESFIQNVLMGSSSARFHRPTSGQGLNETAQAVIKTMRELTDTINFFESEPHNDLLQNREGNEAYCRAIPNDSYVIYFPEGGSVSIKPKTDDKISIQWINVLQNEWKEKTEQTKKNSRASFDIKSPNVENHWIALIHILN